MTATELLEEAHRKMISRKLPDTAAQDFILQVAGTKDYIDGPYPVHSFKYLRQCLTTNERCAVPASLCSLDRACPSEPESCVCRVVSYVVSRALGNRVL